MNRLPLEDAEEFMRLWTSAQPAVSAYLVAHLGDFHDAQDLLQVVAVTALRKFGDFDRTKPFARWVLGMARLEVLRWRRREARSRLVFDEDLAAQLETTCEELVHEFESRARYLPECVAELDGRAAELIRLRYQESLTPAGIANRLGMAAGTVRVALNRVREALRRCVERKLAQEDSPA